MKAISVLCNHCGAPLEIGEGIRFATCGHCGTHLKLQREGGVLFTEILEDIDIRTQVIAEDVKSLKGYKELERLDREWANAKKEIMVQGKDGALIAPSKAMKGGAVLAILSLVGAFLILRFGGPRPMLFMPAFLLIGGIYYFISGSIKNNMYNKARANYENRRLEVLDDIES